MNFVSQVDALIISDLPAECKEPDLLVLAQTYGRVKSCEIKRDFRNHVISMYGIISYYSHESAENAFRALNGAKYMGKALRVNWMPRNLPTNQNPSIPQAPKNLRTAQVHISYLSKQLNFIISEQFLRDVFSNFGTVLEIALKKTCVDPEMSVQNGYGFVHYPLTNEGIQAALTAVSSLHQVTINHITFDCSISNQLNQVLSNMDRNKNRRTNGPEFHSNGNVAPTGRNFQPRNFAHQHNPYSAVSHSVPNASSGLRTMHQPMFPMNMQPMQRDPLASHSGNFTDLPATYLENNFFGNNGSRTFGSLENASDTSSLQDSERLSDSHSRLSDGQAKTSFPLYSTQSFHSDTSFPTSGDISLGSTEFNSVLLDSFTHTQPINQTLFEDPQLNDYAVIPPLTPTSTNESNEKDLNSTGYSVWSA